MSWLSRMRSLLRGVGRRADLAAEMEEEFRFHIEARTRDLLGRGLSPAEAARRARLEFGSIDSMKEQGRESRGLRLLDELHGDARYGVRALLRNPGFTVVAVLTLALGIGANAAIFTALDAIMLRPLPFAEPERLVTIEGVNIPARLGGPERQKSMPDIHDARALDVFTHVAAYAAGGMNLSGVGPARRIDVGVVTQDFFDALGVLPARGRTFSPEEGAPEGPRVAIVSYDVWRRHLAASPDLAGRSITLNGRRYDVVGVMPRGFAFPEEAEVWIPLTVPSTGETFEPFRGFLPSRMIARLAPDATIPQARAALLSLWAPYERQMEIADEKRARPLQAALVDQRRTALLVMLGATALVLLVACVNVANLLLSRGAARRSEIAVRSALGASPGRVLRQLLTESMLLAGIGAVIGVALAFLGTRLLDVLVPPALAGAAPLRIDARVLLYSSGVALLTGLLFGLAPSLGARRTDAGEVLKAAGPTIGGGTARLRQGLVLAEVALAVMLLIGSALMLRSLQALLATETGIEPARVATLEVTLAPGDYRDSAARKRFFEAVLARLDALPEVEAAAAINELPLRGSGGISFTVLPEGMDPADAKHEYMAQDLRITPGYFRAMGIRVLAGRPPEARADTTAVKEVAINHRLAEMFWPGGSAVGQRLVLPGFDAWQVVGVVEDVRPFRLESEIIPQAYYALMDGPYANAAIVARGRVPARTLVRLVEAAVREAAPDQAVYNVRTMEQVIGRTVAPRRTNTLLITAFGVLALVLAAIGVYGVIAFNVARRTREIGIRMALGADRARLRRDILAEATVLALAGIALGTLGAFWLSRVLASMLYGIEANDPVSFVAAPLVLLAAAVLAALAPASRATRIDPVSAIRSE